MKITPKYPKCNMIEMKKIIRSKKSINGTDDKSVLKLVDEIRKFGLLKLPVIQKTTKGNYQVVLGKRHIKALRILKWKIIPVFLIDEFHPAINQGFK